MKKIISLFISICVVSTLLAGCGATDTKKEQPKPTTKVEEKKGPTQEEINTKLKKEAVKADFKKINGHEKEMKDSKVFVTGKISNIDTTQKIELFKCFTITAKEGDGYGMYIVYNILDFQVKEGDNVTIYGTINEDKSKTGMPIIIGTVMENQ